MFDDLSSRLERVFKRLKGEGTVRERHLDETLHELRLALLQADVSHEVCEDFVATVRERALGADVQGSLTPAQQIIAIVRDQLVELLGGKAHPLRLPQQKCGVVVLVGLQGSGKTTSAAKLARNLKEQGKVPLLVSADFSRPAARDQLEVLGQQVGVRVFTGDHAGPLEATKAAAREAALRGFDALIVDSAGRLHVDDELMAELKTLVAEVNPVEVLFVGDSMTGQDAVRQAKSFDEAIPLTGIILTKLDGDARGGAALSMAKATGKPVRFAGLGEKPEDFDLFQPERMVSRLLGMGDVLTLIEKVQRNVDAGQAAELTRKARKGELTLEDFRDQLRQVRKMGDIEDVLKLMPGGRQLAGNLNIDDRWSVHAEAIINSMTKKERRNHKVVDSSRKRRIARGAGRPLSEVNRLIKSFKQARQMHHKMLSAGKGGRRMPGLPGLPIPR